MRKIDLIVIHCSATRADRDFTEEDLRCATAAVVSTVWGYHFYIRKNGSIKTTREIERIGAHAKGHNLNSIGICYEGGLDCHGRPADTRTEWQIHSMNVLILTLLRDYPGCRICGHRDLSPRPERERGDRAGGMGEGLPVLRRDEGMEVIIGECHSRLL